MRKILVSNAFGASAEFAALARPTWEQFAALHGWEVRVGTEPPPGAVGRQALKLVKLDSITEALKDAGLVLWIDADAMFTRVGLELDIAGALFTSDFQGLVLERFAQRFNPNTGVWLLRADPENDEFLDVLRTIDVPADYVWMDQARVMKALGWQLTPMPHGVKPVCPSPYLARTGWLSPEWNVIAPDARYMTRIRHFAGHSRADRLEGMLTMLAEMVRLTTVPRSLLEPHVLAAVDEVLTRHDSGAVTQWPASHGMGSTNKI